MSLFEQKTAEMEYARNKASDTAQQKRGRKNSKRLAEYMPAGFARLKDPRCGDGGEACTHCLISGKCLVSCA